MKLQSFLKILLLSNIVFGQVTLSKEEVRNIANKIDSLQTIYSNQIEINMDAFEKIKLTKTDMMVIQRGVPFPIMVPSFPILTSDNKLNYGRNIHE